MNLRHILLAGVSAFALSLAACDNNEDPNPYDAEVTEPAEPAEPAEPVDPADELREEKENPREAM